MSERTRRDVARRGTAPARRDASSSTDVSNFLERAASVRPASGEAGRIVFALDATMSRQPTWDAACQLQGEMFEEVGRVGGLAVQLVYFRSFNECRASKWVSDTGALRNLMTGLEVRAGRTQIGKVLTHVRREGKLRRVNALVYVGDAMEENVDELAHRAGELGLLGVPAFMFQEGRDAETERAYREIARLSRGAYMRFDAGAAAELARLLRAVARFAAGGAKALENGGATERKLLEQLR